ncbi:PREDICTED: uncharacterized protein LOC109243437 [Nicotiana attenuata]|uniref:uncharacterized protein LOC109243437 n=1 Tax=Nicotiana attenuata TaxID=49451 RepID=UPI000904E721|nr:PREDICTED: uncharacterized protein LOC109243437 [Nicotiana attenuata]
MSDLLLKQRSGTQNHIPPKPPDKFNPQTPNTLSYKDTLIQDEFFNNITTQSVEEISTLPKDIQSTELDDHNSGVLSHKLNQIILSEEDRKRMYNPCKFSIIIKLMGKRLVHHYFKKKIQDLWKINENFPLINFGENYYTIKLAKEESMTKILHNGPWFINGFFLSVQKWVPNFVAKEAHQSYTAVWVRLPQLPTEFYDGIILTRIGNCIGKLLKVDARTSTTLRGRYARLYVELPLEQQCKTIY